MTRLKNTEFAAMTGCDMTTASRMRKGERLPSLALMARMWKAFKLDGNAIFWAYLQGRPEFTAFLNRKIFEPEAPETGTATDCCPVCGRSAASAEVPSE